MKNSENPVLPEVRVTLDDVRHRAEAVKSIAVSQVRGAVRTVTQDKATQALAIVAGVVVVTAFVAYSLGSRRPRYRDDS